MKTSKRRKIIAATVPAIFVFALLSLFFSRTISRLSMDFYYSFTEGARATVYNVGKISSLMRQSRMELAERLVKEQNRVDELSLQLKQLEKIDRERRDLREFLDLPPPPEYRPVYAQILVRDPLSWYKRLTINKGSEDGIAAGNIVLSRKRDTNTTASRLAVIGRITSVSRHSAVLSTITAREIKLSVYLPESGVAGILNGGGRRAEGFFGLIRYLPRDVPYKSGEKVVTSGMGSKLPPGLLVGFLAGNGESAELRLIDKLYAEATFTPIADFDKINVLLVLVPEQ